MLRIGWMLLTVLAVSSSAALSAPCKLAVTALEPQGLAANEAHLPGALTDALTVAVANASGCEVISSSDIATIAGFEAQRSLCGVGGDDCLAELGDALGVDRIVAGTIARVGTSTTVTARLVNIKASRVEARAEETTTDPNHLREMSQSVGRALFAPATGGTGEGPPLPLLIGGTAVGVGALAATVGLILALEAEGVLGEPSANQKQKDDAIGRGVFGTVVVGAGGIGLVAGVVVAVIGLVGE